MLMVTTTMMMMMMVVVVVSVKVIMVVVMVMVTKGDHYLSIISHQEEQNQLRSSFYRGSLRRCHG